MVLNRDTAGNTEEFHLLRGLSTGAHSAGRKGCKRGHGSPQKQDKLCPSLTKGEVLSASTWNQKLHASCVISRKGWYLLLCICSIFHTPAPPNTDNNSEPQGVPADVHLPCLCEGKWTTIKQKTGKKAVIVVKKIQTGSGCRGE